jgi:hypothetical protein
VLRNTAGQWDPEHNRFGAEQVSLVVKATQRTLTAADGGGTKCISLEQLCCYICEWEMKPLMDLRDDRDEIWVLFEGDKVKWFCNSYSCQRAIGDGKHAELLSGSSVTIPDGSLLSELWSLPETVSVSKGGSCSASFSNALTWGMVAHPLTVFSLKTPSR